MKNIKKINKIIIAVLLITAFCGTGVLLAWFTNGDRLGGMSFKIAKINSTVTLYKANDSNFNGIPDLLAVPDATSYNYYTEKYSFDTANKMTDVALSEDPTNITLSISVTDVFPSKVFTYKFALENKSEASNEISIRFNEKVNLLSAEIRLLSTLSFRTAYVDTENNIHYNSNKAYMFNSISGTTIGEATVLQDVSVKGLIEAGTSKTNCYDFWLMIEMEPYDALVELFGDNIMTEAEYNELQGMTLTLPDFKVFFEIHG